MNTSTRFHPAHGLNPTIPVCFWCGKDRNEVVLLGAAYKNEAPMRMLFDYNPCATCKENFAKGILLVEVSTESTCDLPPIQGDHYPTGKWAVVSEDLIRRSIVPDTLAQKIIDKRKAFVDEGTLKALGIAESEEH